MPVRELEAASESPVSLEMMKAHLRVQSTSEDALIQLYIRAATRAVEGYTRRALVQRAFVQTLDEFPCDAEIQLKMSRLVEVTKVEYVSVDGAVVEWDEENYSTDASGLFGRIVKKLGVVWPWTLVREPAAVRITFIAGYGETGETVPEGLQVGILLLAANFYERRVPVADGMIQEVPLTYRYLLDIYKIFSV